ncbi:general transcription factor 3C polypeptide 4-like [Ptychodera flava]|uniref:general transcription factor 3C polypeptide 4-like n=1 Tax=Ptychodera flava TaxID=63121 RepID=UPI00396A3109
MAAPTVTCVVPLSHSICGSEVLCWSPDHKIAIATNRSVYVMDMQCSPNDINKSFTLPKCVIAAPGERLEFDVGITEDDIMKKIDSQPSEALSFMMTDPTLTPRIRAVEVATGYKIVKWSPLHCDHLGRCVLSCLTLDHRLTIYKHTGTNQWHQVVDLSEVLYKRLKANHFEYQPSTHHDHVPQAGKYKDYETYMRRRYMLASVAMDWSDVFHDQTEKHDGKGYHVSKKRKVENGDNAKSFVFLFSYMKSGHIAIWKCYTPVTSESSVSLYTSIDTHFLSPSTIAWCHRDNYNISTENHGLLAAGDSSGQVRVWDLNVHDKAVVRSSLMIWQDRDLLSVDRIAWQYKADNAISILSITKGHHLVVFLIKTNKSGIEVIDKCQPYSVHPLSITGLTFQHNIILSSSVDGTVNKTTININNDSISLETDSIGLVDSPEQMATKYYAVILSPNVTFVAIVACETKYFTGKDLVEVRFLEIKSMEGVVQELQMIEGNLSYHMDALELIRQRVTTEGELPKPLRQFIDGISNLSRPTSLKIQLFLLKLQLSLIQQTTVPKSIRMDLEDTQTKDEATTEREQALIEEITVVEKKIMKSYVIRQLNRWLQDPSSIVKLTNAAKTTLLTMADWLYHNYREDSEQLVSSIYVCLGNKPDDAAGREICTLCYGKLESSDVRIASCAIGHSWGRCCLTLRICVKLPYRRCSHCGSKAINIENIDDAVGLTDLLHQPCTFCDGVLL